MSSCCLPPHSEPFIEIKLYELQAVVSLAIAAGYTLEQCVQAFRFADQTTPTDIQDILLTANTSTDNQPTTSIVVLGWTGGYSGPKKEVLPYSFTNTNTRAALFLIPHRGESLRLLSLERPQCVVLTPTVSLQLTPSLEAEPLTAHLSSEQWADFLSHRQPEFSSAVIGPPLFDSESPVQIELSLHYTETTATPYFLRVRFVKTQSTTGSPETICTYDSQPLHVDATSRYDATAALHELSVLFAAGVVLGRIIPQHTGWKIGDLTHEDTPEWVVRTPNSPHDFLLFLGNSPCCFYYHLNSQPPATLEYADDWPPCVNLYDAFPTAYVSTDYLKDPSSSAISLPYAIQYALDQIHNKELLYIHSNC